MNLYSVRAVDVVMVSDILPDYAAWLRACGHAPETIRAREKLAANRLAAWRLEGFTVDNIVEWLARDLKPWSRATYYSNLKDFCLWLAASGYLEASPFDDDRMRKPRRPTSLPRPLSDREMALILSRATGRTLDWIILARREGLRAHEIAKLRGADVSEAGLYVLGKGGKEVVLPLHPEVALMAEQYPAAGYWFPSRMVAGQPVTTGTVTSTVSRLFTTLGIEGSIHRVRHNFGTDLLRAGVNIRVVQKLMRHSSLATTEVYTAVHECELTAAINRLPGWVQAS